MVCIKEWYHSWCRGDLVNSKWLKRIGFQCADKLNAYTGRCDQLIWRTPPGGMSLSKLVIVSRTWQAAISWRGKRGNWNSIRVTWNFNSKQQHPLLHDWAQGPLKNDCQIMKRNKKALLLQTICTDIWKLITQNKEAENEVKDASRSKKRNKMNMLNNPPALSHQKKIWPKIESAAPMVHTTCSNTILSVAVQRLSTKAGSLNQCNLSLKVPKL